MSNTIYIGVDPGTHTGLAALTADGLQGAEIKLSGRASSKIEQCREGLSSFLDSPAIVYNTSKVVFIVLQTAVGGLNKHSMRVLAKHQAYMECACDKYGEIVEGWDNPLAGRFTEATDMAVRSICGLPNDKEKAIALFVEKYWPRAPRLKTGRVNDHICDAAIAAMGLAIRRTGEVNSILNILRGQR